MPVGGVGCLPMALVSQPGRGRRGESRALGFSLTELLVVVGIVVLLIGILVPVVTGMYRRAAESQTRNTLSAAKAIADEYELQTGSAVNHLSSVTTPFNWNLKKAYNNPTMTGQAVISDTGERFCWAAMQVENTARMLPALGGEVFKDGDGNGFMELRDGWGHKIRYAAKVEHGDADGTDDELPEYPRPFFASAGYDGQFGNAETGDASQPPLQDNLYSFNLE